jgi:hypothetical protein
MTDLVRGKVARILNSRDLVINRGSKAGVTLGMRFAVLDGGGEGITDPDTGKVIGAVQRTKVQVEVTQLSELLAVARTYRTFSVNVGGLGGGLGQLGDVGRMFAPPRIIQKPETLKQSEANWEPLTEAQSIVKVGDPAVEIRVTDDDVVGGIITEPEELESPAEIPPSKDT